MSRTAFWLLSAGVILFVGVLVSQGLQAVLATLAAAGWGLPLLAILHLLPLVLDAASIRVLLDSQPGGAGLSAAVIARWAGESANSFLPAGPIGGPIVMSRLLAQRGIPMARAAAAVTVSTTLQTLAQIVFVLIGMVVLAAQASASRHALWLPLAIAGALLTFCLAGFYLMQRRGLFGQLVRLTARVRGKGDWSQHASRAAAIDAAIEAAYGRSGRMAWSFGLSLIGWLVGTAEVYLVLRLLSHPVSWTQSLLLESLGQAIRAAGFAIPGSLGVQEGGYLLLAPLANLRPDVALALSLAKRARELLLGLPGLVYLHRCERLRRQRAPVERAVAE